jgi:hypothetical protein
MELQLDGIKDLYKSMKIQKIERYRFDYKSGNAVFNVFFFIDGSPFKLLFGAKGHTFGFEVEVGQGFKIETNLEKSVFKELCIVLGLTYDPNNKFSPFKFFNDFNNSIPKTAIPNQPVEPSDVAPYVTVAEEEKKVYFTGWRDQDVRGSNVTEKNLDKTRELIGEKEYKTCKEKNISSCWSDSSNKAKKITLPK